MFNRCLWSSTALVALLLLVELALLAASLHAAATLTSGRARAHRTTNALALAYETRTLLHAQLPRANVVPSTELTHARTGCFDVHVRPATRARFASGAVSPVAPGARAVMSPAARRRTCVARNDGRIRTRLLWLQLQLRLQLRLRLDGT